VRRSSRTPITRVSRISSGRGQCTRRRDREHCNADRNVAKQRRMKCSEEGFPTRDQRLNHPASLGDLSGVRAIRKSTLGRRAIHGARSSLAATECSCGVPIAGLLRASKIPQGWHNRSPGRESAGTRINPRTAPSPAGTAQSCEAPDDGTLAFHMSPLAGFAEEREELGG
jgi:hypothetical protein